MTIKVTEVGKVFNSASAFDISGNTELTLKFTSPAGIETTFTKTGGRVSAPAVAGGTDATIPANTYFQLTTIATDFTEAGTWQVCSIYNDATPKEFHGNPSTFTVLEDC